MRKHLILLTLLLSWVWSSCDKSEDSGKIEEPAFTLEVLGKKNPESLKIGSASYTKELTIKSNVKWAVEKPETDTWLTISPESGEGNGLITLTAEENELTTLRESELTFYARDKKTYTLTIRQEPVGFYMVVEPKMPSIPALGGDVVLTVTTNVSSWTYTIKGDNSSWLTEKSKDATSITFTASKNTLESEQTATVEFTTPADASIKQVVTVTQVAKPAEASNLILDVVFNSDGTAKDVSPMKLTVQELKGPTLMTYYNDGYGCNVARFNQTAGAGGLNNGFYRVDYQNNQKFKDALADGHTLETLFMYDSEFVNTEVKMFSSMQGGGTGFLLSIKDGRKGDLTFLPNVSTTGGSTWTWNHSGVVLERGKYYHVVGVWNKETQKASIYVNGELKGTVDAKGSFIFPSPDSFHWFGIGGDPSGATTADGAWKGDVVLARIYDDPLSADDVTQLWDKVKDKQSQNTIQISDILFLPGFEVKAGSKYRIAGKGYQAGDKVRLETLTADRKTYTCDATVTDSYIDAIIPADFTTGEYKMVLVRGTAMCPLGVATLTLSDNPTGLIIPKVIAHRGYFTSPAKASQNSIASFKEAQTLGVYGSETDFYITLDNVVVCNHDPIIGGKKIEDVNYAEIKDMTLGNGEKLPTLEVYLEQMKANPDMKLVLEIKVHGSNEKHDRIVKKVIEMVNSKGLTSQLDYISFSYYVCQQLVGKVPAGTAIGYLQGDKAPGSMDQGINCIDYPASALRNNPKWIKEAHAKGMTVNVWTINTVQEMAEFIGMGVDYITTDYPQNLKEIVTKLSE